MYLISKAIIQMPGGDKKFIRKYLVENIEDERTRLITEYEGSSVSFTYEDLTPTIDEEYEVKPKMFTPKKAI